MDEVNVKFMTDNYLEWFAAEFCKHNELMKPCRYTRALSREHRRALLRLGAAAGCGDVKATLRYVRTFRQHCVNKMRLLVRQAPHAGGGVLVLAPPWLQKLDRPFGLVAAALKLEAPGAGPAEQFSWELYWSVRAAVLSEPARLLRGAGDAFADRKGLPRDTVQAVWRRLHDAALAKLRASSRGGDRAGAERPTRLDWRIIDLALLYSSGASLLLPVSFSTSPELEAMLQLYKLMSDAHRRLDGDRLGHQSSAGATPTEESENAIDQPRNRTTDNIKDAAPQPPDEPEWESAETWIQVHADYCRSGRAVSLVALQRRWFELRALARRSLLLAAHRQRPAPHPLLLAVAKRFPRAAARPAAWAQLVAAKRIHVDDFGAQEPAAPARADEPNPILMNDLMADLLDWSDDEPELIETDRAGCIQIDSDAEEDTDLNNTSTQTDTPSKGLVNESDDSSARTRDTDLPADSTEANQTYIPGDKTTAVVKSEPFGDIYSNEATDISEPLEQKVWVNVLAQQSHAVHLDIKVKENPEDMPEHTVPKKSRIMFEDEDDLDEINKFEAKQELLRLNAAGDAHTSGKTEPIQIYIKAEPDKDSPGEGHSHHQIAEVKSEPADDSSEVEGSCDACYPEVQPVTSGLQCTSGGRSEPSQRRWADGSAHTDIDEKLLMLTRVVLVPLELLPRRRPAASAAPGRESSPREQSEARQPAPAAPRRTGIAGELRALLSALPRGHKVMRRRLTARLRLARTALPAGFWASARNLALLSRCRAARVLLLRPRPVRRVALPDLEQVRRVNRGLLTATVAPARAQGRGAPDEATDEAFADMDAPAVAEPLSEAALKELIRTLTVPSIREMRAANARLRARLDCASQLLRYREEERAKAQRSEYKQLYCDILQIVRSLENEGLQKPEPKPVKKRLVLGEDEKPLPDAYQEWQRQKTLVHKYFNFYQPDTCKIPKDGKNKRKKIKAGNKTAARHRHTKKMCQNTIDLMNVSDDEQGPGTGNDSTGHIKPKNPSVINRSDAKRSSSGKAAENCNKRVKLTESSARNDKDGKHGDSDDDNRMMIDEGVEGGCYEDDPITLTDPSAPEVCNGLPTQLQAWPLNAAPGLNHDRSQKVIHVIPNTNIVSLFDPRVMTAPAVITIGAQTTPPAAACTPVAFAVHDVAAPSTINTRTLLQDVSLTLNTPLTAPNTMWPTVYFIQSDGKTFEKQSAVLEVHPKHLLPLSESGAGAEPSALISEAASQGLINNTPPSATVEEIDLTDDVEDDTAREEVRPRIVSIASLKLIKNEMENNSTAEIVPAAAFEAEELLSMPNTTDDPKLLTIEETKDNGLQSEYENRTFSLEMGPIQTSNINDPTDSGSRILTAAPTNTSNFLDKSFATKHTDRTNDAIETICLDSEDSDEVETSRVVYEREACHTRGGEGEIDATDVVPPTIFKREAADRAPNAAAVTQPTDVVVPNVAQQTEKISAKSTPNSTSDNLLNLSSEKLAQLLEVLDAERGKPEIPKNTTAQGLLPINIKKEKRWEEEIQLSKGGRDVEEERRVGTKGATIKEEAGVTTDDAGSEEGSADSKELVLQGVPTTGDVNSAPPDAICDHSEKNGTA